MDFRICLFASRTRLINRELTSARLPTLTQPIYCIMKGYRGVRACRVRRPTWIKETRPKFNNGNAARSLHIWLAGCGTIAPAVEAREGPGLIHQPGPDQRLFHFDDVMIHPYANVAPYQSKQEQGTEPIPRSGGARIINFGTPANGILHSHWSHLSPCLIEFVRCGFVSRGG